MNIVITGSSRGLGLALTHELLNRKGHVIIGISRNPGCESKNALSKYLHILTDLSQAENITKAVEKIHGFVDSVDVLVNNAGILIHKPFIDTSPEEIHRLFSVNFRSAALLIQKLLPFMKPGSHIMNIGSMGGVQGSVKFPGLAFYSASKAALTVLSEVLAEELKPRGVHVNCLAPGSIQTEMLAEAFPGYQASFSPDELAQFLADFVEKNYRFFNGKTLPLAITTP